MLVSSCFGGARSDRGKRRAVLPFGEVPALGAPWRLVLTVEAKLSCSVPAFSLLSGAPLLLGLEGARQTSGQGEGDAQ